VRGSLARGLRSAPQFEDYRIRFTEFFESILLEIVGLKHYLLGIILLISHYVTGFRIILY